MHAISGLIIVLGLFIGQNSKIYMTYLLLILSHIDIDNSNYNSSFCVTIFLLYLLSSIWEFFFLINLFILIGG